MCSMINSNTNFFSLLYSLIFFWGGGDKNLNVDEQLKFSSFMTLRDSGEIIASKIPTFP